jgi:MraZ protein
MVEMVLTGSFDRTLDEKLRVTIPKRVRAVLESSPEKAVYVAPGSDGSLVIHTEESFQRLADRLSQASPTRQDVRTFMRLFYAQAQRVELDALGRLRIPPVLAAWAGLQKDVVLLGVQDHVELWAAERWQAYLHQHQPQYDQIAERAFDTESKAR